MSNDLRALGRSVRAARKRQRITQQQLAAELGVSQSWLCTLETGTTLRKLDQALVRNVETWLRQQEATD